MPNHRRHTFEFSACQHCISWRNHNQSPMKIEMAIIYNSDIEQWMAVSLVGLICVLSSHWCKPRLTVPITNVTIHHHIPSLSCDQSSLILTSSPSLIILLLNELLRSLPRIFAHRGGGIIYLWKYPFGYIKVQVWDKYEDRHLMPVNALQNKE